jgi:hypothetical protein
VRLESIGCLVLYTQGDTHDWWQEVRKSNFQSRLFCIFVTPLTLLARAVNISGER